VKRSSLGHKILRAVYNYFVFFLLSAFLVTCTTALFVSVLSDSLGIELTDEDLRTAAKLTFLNVIALSSLFTAVDAIRRKLTTEKVTNHITSAARKIVKGELDVRLEPINSFSADDNYNVIIDCFNTMAEELKGVETLRTDFIANVSHEMKTPIAVMQNYGTLLATPDLPEEKRIEYAKAVTDASRRLSAMMTNILKLNRLENQQIYPEVETYDLGEQLCETLLMFENVWESRGIDIETDIAEGVFVSADAELLSLVWNNLFSNAFKFTGDGGKVSLSLSVEGKYAVVKVADTGCGMSPEIGAHIFEKFYQGDTSRATEGNGLGLALVKRVVDIMQGEIGVESEVGVGSAFTIKIRREENGSEKNMKGAFVSAYRRYDNSRSRLDRVSRIFDGVCGNGIGDRHNILRSVGVYADCMVL